MAFLVDDQDFIVELRDQEDDRDVLRIMVAEMFCKAVAVKHMAQRTGTIMTFVEAYTSCAMELMRSAFEDNTSPAYVFYDCLDDTCPKCANVFLAMLGLAIESDIYEHLDSVTSYVDGMGAEIESEALAFVTRQAVRVLLGVKMQAITAECLESCTDNERTIESMRDSG